MTDRVCVCDRGCEKGKRVREGEETEGVWERVYVCERERDMRGGERGCVRERGDRGRRVRDSVCV